MLTDKFEYSGNELDIFSNARNWKKYWRRMIDSYVNGKVLDVGAGVGSTASNFADRYFNEWNLLEPDKNFYNKLSIKINSTQMPKNCQTIHGDLSCINNSKKFDSILYIDVLEHIKDDRQELKMAAELLQKNGYLVILSPAYNFLYTEFDLKIGHFRRYSKSTLKKILPLELTVEKIFYLDCVGICASLINKILLMKSEPSLSQIKFWDKYLIPISQCLDKILLNKVGKTIICVLKKS
jgi:2-polyprenyl-3-methyl-5-hydroxy-6-metoxy-1,4-benzoquinol methylase